MKVSTKVNSDSQFSLQSIAASSLWVHMSTLGSVYEQSMSRSSSPVQPKLEREIAETPWP